MSQTIQSLITFPNAKTDAAGLQKPLAETSQSPGLSGIEETLKGFDSYLQDAAGKNGSLQEKMQDNTKFDLSGLDNIEQTDGKPGGNLLPLNGQQIPESANYTTAAQNLLSDLSSNAKNENTEAAYGLFDSPLYKTLIGANPSADTAIDQNTQHLKASVTANTNGAIAIGAQGFSDTLNNQRFNGGSAAGKGQGRGDYHSAQNGLLGLDSINKMQYSMGAQIDSGANSVGSNMSFEQLQNSISALQSNLASAHTLDESGANPADKLIDSANPKDPNAASLTAGAKGVDANHVLRMKMDAAVQQEGWNREFAMKMTSMASAGEQSASLQLHPSELGSIEITMTTENDKAKVHFVVQTAGAREALENSLPKLREFFEESGMTLSDAGVEDQSTRSAMTEQQEQKDSNEYSSLADDPSETGLDDTKTESINGQLDNMVDYYI